MAFILSGISLMYAGNNKKQCHLWDNQYIVSHSCHPKVILGTQCLRKLEIQHVVFFNIPLPSSNQKTVVRYNNKCL